MAMQPLSQPDGLRFDEIPQWCVDNDRKFYYQAGRVRNGIHDEIDGLAGRYEQASLDAESYSASADMARRKLDEFAVKSVRDLPAYASLDDEPGDLQARADEAEAYLSSGYPADVKDLYRRVYDTAHVHTPESLCDRDSRDGSVKYPFSVSMDTRDRLNMLAGSVRDPDTGKPLPDYDGFEREQLDKALDDMALRHTGRPLSEIKAGFDASRAAAPKQGSAPEAQKPSVPQRRASPRGVPATGNLGPSDPYGFDEYD